MTGVKGGRHNVHHKSFVGVDGLVWNVVVVLVGVNGHRLSVCRGGHGRIVLDGCASTIDQLGLERVLAIGHDSGRGTVP